MLRRSLMNTKVKPHEHYNKMLLPTPIAVLQQLGLPFGKANFKGYLKLPCPFHKDGAEKNPSLNLHQINGHYRCHACGVKGGNILAFYMSITGKKFKTAAKELGAWEYRL